VSESGATVIEFAFAATAFLAMMFGVINIARVTWTLGSLHYAVEAAARCASVNSTSCGNATAIQNYAQGVYSGESLSSNPFTYSATGCGHTVTATYNYALTIPPVGTWTIPLSATACFP
jgi:Flp pilus assembly protein TadG